MAKYYPDIAKGAKGTRALFLVYLRVRAERERDLSLSLSLLFFFFERRRRRRRSFRLTLLLSLITHITTTTDLFTGALSYENKFSLDAKPISGGVRFLFFSFGLVFCFLPRERERSRKRDGFLLFSVFPKQNVSPGKEGAKRVAFLSLSLSLLCFSKKKTLTFTRAALSFKKKTVRLCDD